MDKFAVEGTPSEDFLEVLARILPIRFRGQVDPTPVNSSEEAARDSCFVSDAWIIPQIGHQQRKRRLSYFGTYC